MRDLLEIAAVLACSGAAVLAVLWIMSKRSLKQFQWMSRPGGSLLAFVSLGPILAVLAMLIGVLPASWVLSGPALAVGFILLGLSFVGLSTAAVAGVRARSSPALHAESEEQLRSAA
jgi:hypothetical protein